MNNEQTSDETAPETQPTFGDDFVPEPKSESVKEHGHDGLSECEFAAMTEAPAPPEPKPIRLALLPPDHPLLAKFQANLKEYLLRTKEQLKSEIAEIKYQLKLKEATREEQGAKLYDLQQGIKRQNEQLDEYGQEIQTNMEKRVEMEGVVAKLKEEFEERFQVNKNQKQKYNKRMVELENLNTLEGHIRNWADEVEDEVKNAKRIVDRDTQLQKQLSEDKKKSDMLFYHLDMEVKKKEHQIEIMRSEVQDMREITDALKMSINDANTDLEVLQTEHKRLTLAWSEVIVAIQHRDKILYQAQQAMGKEQESMKLNTRSIEAIKKQIAKETKLNEKLEVFKSRLLADCGNIKRECQKQSDTLLALQTKLEELPLWLEQNEKDLTEANREGTNLETELRRLQLKCDKMNARKYQLEENMLKLAQEGLITDKASQYRLKLFREAQETRRATELNLAIVQSQLSEILLDIERYRGILIRLNQEQEELQKRLDIAEHNAELISAETRNMETQIDLKLKKVDRLSSRVAYLSGIGEDEGLNATRKKIKLLEKAISSMEQQIRELQQFWLMMQNHYVNLSEKRNNQLNEMQVTQKQLGIVKQKSLKIDVDLEKQEEATKELERDIEIFLTKLEILNKKISKARQQHDTEENECQLEHTELVLKLKDHEMNVLNMEAEIDELQDEIEHYKDLVLDKHRESLSWETKYKLIEETLRWRKDETNLTSEIGNMKSEIHRMRIRFQQLMRAQEKLAQDLQHGVAHREHIYVAASAKKLAEVKAQRMKTGISSEQKVIDLRNRLKKIQNEISIINDQQLVKVTRENERIRADLNRLYNNIEGEKANDEEYRQKIDECMLLKHYNLERIVRKQNRAKSYRRLGVGTVTPKMRSDSTIGQLVQKQMEINDNLLDVVQILTNDFAEKKKFFAKIIQVLRD
ncbi:coiled-coil domain-containing protein 40-like [Rhagoletis pomonella]|uniref:coiled-coil domain-containing protein 40-like n=1 Tax=Rhagoletis pomonella TaxID=28610 RepID=UPI00177CFAF4|nr:coiled-coil domain-containing protein 40-like [Rhagoletis pomonella]XP_036342664.1 coiled-coil domain-containing protein 40-like [Rhagoletis pomonella]